jgi:hypothetical protein
MKNNGNTPDPSEDQKTTAEEIQEKLEFMGKIIIYILLAFLLPLLPWIALSYYTFKKVYQKFNDVIVTM